jgi:hypothetical protein
LKNVRDHVNRKGTFGGCNFSNSHQFGVQGVNLHFETTCF